jgi:beta-lactamase regulating signal transducer with metallopeptidase domain
MNNSAMPPYAAWLPANKFGSYPTVRTTRGKTVASKPSVVGRQLSETKQERCKMLWTIFVILLVLWLLGVVSSYTLGGFIHLLLVVALVVLVIQLLTGRRPVL